MEQYEHVLWNLINVRIGIDKVDSPQLCELMDKLILSVAALCGIEVCTIRESKFYPAFVNGAKVTDMEKE